MDRQAALRRGSPDRQQGLLGQGGRVGGDGADFYTSASMKENVFGELIKNSAETILKKENKKVDYKKIGKRGILKTKPFNTTIIVDGKTYVHSNVWLASCMKGRYNGSGMMLSPLQDRTTGDVSLIVFTQKSKLKALKLFSKIFKKNHLENTESFIVYTGKSIEVTSNIPLTLHIDGEKVTDVTTYKVNTK